MTKAKNTVYENGMKFSCGPPMKSGGYNKWNWCKLCSAIYDKNTVRCSSCNQQIRSKAKSNANWPE